MKRFLLLAGYLAASAYLLWALIGTVYFEPTTEAVTSAQAAWGQAVLAIVALFFLALIVGLMTRKVAAAYIALPAALVLVSNLINSDSLFPEIVILVTGIPCAIALVQLVGKGQLSKWLQYLLIGLLVGGVLLVGYQLFYKYRTGVFNPYTQTCIQQGATGAVGDSCVGGNQP